MYKQMNNLKKIRKHINWHSTKNKIHLIDLQFNSHNNKNKTRKF